MGLSVQLLRSPAGGMEMFLLDRMLVLFSGCLAVASTPWLDYDLFNLLARVFGSRDHLPFHGGRASQVSQAETRVFVFGSPFRTPFADNPEWRSQCATELNDLPHAMQAIFKDRLLW